MRKRIGSGVNSVLSLVGLRLSGVNKNKDTLGDNDPRFEEIYERCRTESMTSRERMYGLYKTVEYVHNAKLEGDIVECGVWRGGSSMVSALTLALHNDTDREIYLYDTFTGMSEPTSIDQKVGADHEQTAELWMKRNRDDHNEWAYAALNVVQNNMATTNYPAERIHYVQGKVEETIPDTRPDRIAVLRLDTDWYESTYHELVHLFPKLVSGGVLIIDDYGHWQGAKEATDQYFREQELTLLLNRIDYTCRIAVKP